VVRQDTALDYMNELRQKCDQNGKDW